MSSSAGRRGTNQVSGGRGTRGAGPPNAAPRRGSPNNQQERRSSPSALSQITRRSQAGMSSPMTRSQTAALSPMTRSRATTNTRSQVAGMTSRPQQQQDRQQHAQTTTREVRAAPIAREPRILTSELEREASRGEDNNNMATTAVRRRLAMEDHDGLTRTKLRKVGEEFMHDKVVKELVFPKQKFASLAELDFSNNPNSICRFMANKLQIEGEDEVKSWWDGVKKHVNEALNRHRNNVIKTIKQLFKGEECALWFGCGKNVQLLVLTTAITKKGYLD